MKINVALYSLLDFEDTQEYEFATKGLTDASEMLELRVSGFSIVEP